ncbi:unnamed protein product [Heterobilharzia americana]|nr:unnamed protein product [Heterobilharzia americana]CAH8552907.1 unnamed protein product [Heterobilharzia americana]
MELRGLLLPFFCSMKPEILVFRFHSPPVNFEQRELDSQVQGLHPSPFTTSIAHCRVVRNCCQTGRDRKIIQSDSKPLGTKCPHI